MHAENAKAIAHFTHLFMNKIMNSLSKLPRYAFHLLGIDQKQYRYSLFRGSYSSLLVIFFFERSAEEDQTVPGNM